MNSPKSDKSAEAECLTNSDRQPEFDPAIPI